jgi:hypothetical protein
VSPTTADKPNQPVAASIDGWPCLVTRHETEEGYYALHIELIFDSEEQRADFWAAEIGPQII